MRTDKTEVVIKKVFLLILFSSSLYADDISNNTTDVSADIQKVSVSLGTSLADRIELSATLANVKADSDHIVYLRASSSFYRTVFSAPSALEAELGYGNNKVDWLSGGLIVKKVPYLTMPQIGFAVTVRNSFGKNDAFGFYIKGLSTVSLQDNGGFGDYAKADYNIKLGFDFSGLINLFDD